MAAISALLLLDEALDGLDAVSRREAIEAIARTNHEHKATLVMVAHRREDLPHTPTHALLLGQSSGADGSGAGGARGATGTGWRAGDVEVFSCFKRRWSSGNEKAAVLPVPVCAAPITSFPVKTTGMACA